MARFSGSSVPFVALCSDTPDGVQRMYVHMIQVHSMYDDEDKEIGSKLHGDQAPLNRTTVWLKNWVCLAVELGVFMI